MPNIPAHRLNPMAAADAATASNLAIVSTANGVLETSRFDVLMGALKRLGNRFDATDPRYGYSEPDTSTHATAITAAEAAAFAAGGILVLPPGKTFNIGTSGITIRTNVDGAGATISYSGTGTALTYGYPTSASQVLRLVGVLPKVIQVAKTTTGWAQAGGVDVGISLQNIYSSDILIPHVQGFAVGVLGYGLGKGVVYNNVTLGHLDNNKVNLKLDADATGWCNENNFYGGRFSHNSNEGTTVSGTRQVLMMSPTASPANNNRLWGPSLEGDVAEWVWECRGHNNWIFNGRYEVGGAGAQILFDGVNAADNGIFYGYQAHTADITQQNGAARNAIYRRSGFAGQLSAGANGAFICSNTSSDSSPIWVAVSASTDPHAGTASTAYAMAVGANFYRGKRTGDAEARVEIDHQNGEVFVSNGTAAPTAGIKASGSAGVILTGTSHGFYGGAAAAKQTVTGSRGGNAALASLLTALAAIGLITDSSSA